MSYDGFYGELSTRGTVNDLLKQANNIKDSLVASEAAVAAGTSEVGWKHAEVTLKAAQVQTNTTLVETKAQEVTLNAAQVQTDANLVSTKAQEVTLKAAQVQTNATLVETKAQEVQDNSDYVAGIAAHYPPDVIGTADPRLTDAREWTATTITQAEAEAGTAITRRAFTAQRVRQAIVAWAPATATRWPTAAEVTGLGTAATRNVGTAAGNVMEVGAFGIGPIMTNTHDFKSAGSINQFFCGYQDPQFFNIAAGVTLAYSLDWWSQLICIPSAVPELYVRSYYSGNSYSSICKVYHTGNTTKNPDGTLKASSPVINLYTDKHDLHSESQFGATPIVVRKSKGVYEITGTLGLRSEGWYLDTPSDRNGNKYFNIEWAQNITPEAEDGVVDEYRDDIVVTIETFERVWNKETGLFENGAPIDINESQARFVQIRFNEIKVEHEEPMNDTN